MSRDGNGTYTLPAGYLATTGQTIEASQHNGPLEDLQTDMNTARPIVAGGTGATTAGAARDNLEIDGKVQDKSAGYTALLTDRSTLIRCTATLTLDLTAAATLGDGWFIRVLADGGDVTVDPDGSETIDGAATLTIEDGESALIVCNGSNFFTDGLIALLDGKEAADAEILKADTDDNVTAGYTATSDDDGTKSSGTYTPDPAGGNFKHIINGGAFTLAAPTATGCYTLVIEIVNNASAGAITFSGFDKESGDALTTTDGDDFQLVITKSNTKVSVVKQDVS